MENKIPGSVTGSNNLTLPLDARVKERLKELRILGKDSFRKGENREWMTIHAEVPIQGPINWSMCVENPGRDVLELRYPLFATKPNPKGGAPLVVVRRTREVAPDSIHSQVADEEKVIKADVVERFEPKMPFTTKFFPRDGFKEKMVNAIGGGE